MTRASKMNIHLTNNLRLSNVPPALGRELMDTLSFTNPKWIENDRLGRWNWKTPRELRFYDKVGADGLWLPRGFLRHLILLCRRHQVSYEIDDRRRELPPAGFTFSGRLKDFQQRAVRDMLAREFGTLSAPTGSGKTVMALFMIARRQQPTLIVVHTQDLARQWMDRIETFLKIPSDEIGLIGGGRRTLGKRITVALVQSLYKCAESVSPGVGHLIVDECHRTPSRTFTDAVTEFDSRFMLGLSATPWRRDKLSKLIFWHLGDVHHKLEEEALIKSGDVLSAEVIWRDTQFKPCHDPVGEYSKMLSELTLDDQRNHLIAADVAGEAQNARGVGLVLSDRKKHCETLQALLKYKYKISSALLTGDLTPAQRQDVHERLRRGEISVLIATGQLIGEGFDFSELSPLYLATPVRFSGRVIQYLGRVLRPAAGKQKAKVYDYRDGQVDVLVAAAHARQRVYDDLFNAQGRPHRR